MAKNSVTYFMDGPYVKNAIERRIMEWKQNGEEA